MRVLWFWRPVARGRGPSVVRLSLRFVVPATQWLKLHRLYTDEMGYKTISLSDAVYRKLRVEKRREESFNDAIERLPAVRLPPLMKYAGAWKPMSRQEYRRVRERLDRIRHGVP